MSAPTLLERVTRAKQTGDWAALVEAVPYARFMGITADGTTGELLGRMAFAPHLIGNQSLPALHGGTLGALLESTAIFQLLWESTTIVLPRTITITVDYLRSARPVDTYAKGRIVKQGRRVASVLVEAWQDDRSKPVATANAHLLILPVDGGGEGA